jgi:DNA-directed RNA polymerase beta subunit
MANVDSRVQAVPCVVVFRALGLEADRDILEHIVYDFNDADMVELMKPSIDVGMPIGRQELALDYIGILTPKTVARSVRGALQCLYCAHDVPCSYWSYGVLYLSKV